MRDFNIYTSQTAPAPSAAVLSGLEDQLGFVPNVFAVLGGSTPALAAFAALNQNFADSSLSALEREIVQTAVSVRNECGYCVAGHTAFTRLQALDEATVNAIRNVTKIEDPRHEALRRFTESLVETKGQVPEAALADFLAAGYGRDQVFEIIIGITAKMFSNLTSGVTGIPLDDAFAPFGWAPPVSPTKAA